MLDSLHETALGRIRQLQACGKEVQAARLEGLLAQADEVLRDFGAWEGRQQD